MIISDADDNLDELKYFQIWITYNDCIENKHISESERELESEPYGDLGEILKEFEYVVEKLNKEYKDSKIVFITPTSVGVTSKHGDIYVSVKVLKFDYSSEIIH